MRNAKFKCEQILAVLSKFFCNITLFMSCDHLLNFLLKTDWLNKSKKYLIHMKYSFSTARGNNSSPI